MLTVDDATALILSECRPQPARSVPLAEAAGCTLAEPVAAREDLPPFDKAMMDGFAVWLEDVAHLPVELEVAAEITAGDAPTAALAAGSAARIMTGAPVPAGADAVIRLEDTESPATDVVRIIRGEAFAELNILRRGALMRAGETILPSGRTLRPQELAILAELGLAEVTVHAPPSVAVLATGNELVPPGEPLGPGKIRNSNEVMLVAQARRWHCPAIGLGIARDNKDDLREKVSRGLESDVLILTGGVSMGALDLVPAVLADLGVRKVFHKVELKPGKPIWFGVADSSPAPAGRTLIFALPGNPVSSMVCSELFVRPAVRKLLGRPAHVGGRSARLTQRHPFREDRPTYFPARIDVRDDGLWVTPSPWKGSADLRGTLDANGVINFPPGAKIYEAGDIVQVHSWASDD